jgi:hypothetical protein
MNFPINLLLKWGAWFQTICFDREKRYVYKVTEDLQKIWQPKHKRDSKEETLSLEVQLGHPERHLQVAMHESLKIAWRAQALSCDQTRGLPGLHILVPGWIKCGVMSSIPHTSLLFNYAQDENLSSLEFCRIDLRIWTFLEVCMCVVAPKCTHKLTAVIDQ